MTVVAMLGGSPTDAKAQLECAIAMTKKLKTTLTGLVAMPDPANAFMYVSGPESVMAGPSAINAVVQAQDESLAALKTAFKDAVAEAGTWLKADFVHETGSVPEFAVGAAMLSDALVFPHGSAASTHALNPAFEHVLMETRLPLVMASASGHADGPCVIAWDGSPQAARAVRLHLPLIRAFGHVIITQHPDKIRAASRSSSAVSPDALAEWLHDERVETTMALIEGRISEGLLSVAREHKAGLLVMGAYGHSRMGEMLFGGTSREMLNEPGGPALALAH